MTKREAIYISVKDTFMWILLTSLVGLIPIIIHLGMGFLVKDINFIMADVVKNGTLVVLCLTIVASIYLDGHFFKKHRTLKKELNISDSDDWFYNLFPFFILSVVIIVTVLDLLRPMLDSLNLDEDALLNTQFFAICLSYMYSFGYKYCMYLIELKK